MKLIKSPIFRSFFIVAIIVYLIWPYPNFFFKEDINIKDTNLGKLANLATAPTPVLASYQFVPVSGVLVTGTEQTITSAAAAAAEGVNVGSWKGTLADDNFHWLVGSTALGIDFNLTVGGAQLNGANKLIIQTEIDLDDTVPQLLAQICDWVSSTNVDNAADAQCTTGGWRTLNTKDASQVAVAYIGIATDALQWHIYDGYWSTGTTGGTPVSTPLSNFVNGSNQIKIRYYSVTNTTSVVAVDFLRAYAVIDPIYHPAEFVQITGGTATGHYGNAVVMGNTTVDQQTYAGDAIYFDVPGTAGAIADYYFKFKNIKTYIGMNTILVAAENLCSAGTLDLSYRFKIRNFTAGQWEDISSDVQCSTSVILDYFAKNNVTVSNYINGSNEVWVGVYASANSTTNIRLDSIYITLGTTNTDATACEISFGSNTAGRIAENPGGHVADRIQAMAIDSASMYLAGYDSIGYDNEWRIEKRNLTDGALVTAFDTDGVITTDPSTGADQIFAIATTTTHIFLAGFDTAPGNNQWRIEKRDGTTGALMTAFDTDGIIQFNPAGDVDQITSIAVDSSFLYVTGFEDDDTGVWRIHKYDITDGSLVTAFDTDGIITETLTVGAGDERPQSIKVDGDYLYIAGYDIEAGDNQWRMEKRNKTTGALCDGVGNCAAGAFDTDGIIQNNPSANLDRIYAMAIDSSYIYLGGHDGVLSSTNGQWRIEKRDITTGALVTAFDTDGIIQVDPNAADIEWVTDMTVDSAYLYVAGFVDDDAGAWRVEKRDITTGALVTAFDTDGIAQSEDGGDDRANAIAVNASNVFVAGYGSAPGNNQWLIEKRDITTGLRTNDSFGSNNCAGTRDIDITGNNIDAWTIQTEDESTSFSHTFYPLDNDGDAVVEEAGSANIGFSVTAPSNAAVTGIYWGARAMSGAGGTVRHAIKDYSGLTGTTGGRSLVGSSLTTGMAYTDPLISGGVGSGGMAGFMTNPEDYIDTVNNTMRLNLNTTTDGASNVNSVNVLDFAMVSLQWIETGVAAATVSCATDNSSTSFGNLTDASVFTSSPNASTTMSCSGASSGCTLYVKDVGGGGNPGLWKSASPTKLIPSPDADFSATTTIVAGTEGYGIQATTTASGSGGALIINSRYNQTGNTVGGLILTDLTIASSTVDITNREVVATHKAAISDATLSGSYSDTITYSCIVN